MILYLVSLASSKKISEWVLSRYPKDEIGPLCTFATPKQLQKTIDMGFVENILLDSGAFTVFNSGGHIDIDDYIQYIKDHQGKVKNLTATVLDVIGDYEGSVRNWDYMRSKGTNPIPVYHLGEPFEVLDYYVSHTDHIGIGGIAGVTSSASTINPPLQRIYARHPEVKVHLFGVVDFRIVQRFPFNSCDALTWRGGSRFGELVTEHGRVKVGRDQNSGWNVPGVKEYIQQKWVELGFEEELTIPFGSDFDYNLIDMINIDTLYQQIVKFNKGLEERYEMPMSIGLFS